MISRRESKRRFSGIKRICRNKKDSIMFRDGVEYDTAFLHSHISMEKVNYFVERIYTVRTKVRLNTRK